MRKDLSKKDQYLQQLFYIDDPVLNKIEIALKEDNKWGINISGHELSLLKFLIESLNVKSVLEIGTLYGYSAYGIANFLPAGGKIVSIEKSKENFTKSQELLKGNAHEQKLELVQQEATEYLQSCNEKFDLIFIDANKSAYLTYLEKSFDLLNPEGVIVGDNTFLFGHVYGDSSNQRMSEKNIETMKEFNRKYVNKSGYTCTIIPTTEGMTLIKKSKA